MVGCFTRAGAWLWISREEVLVVHGVTQQKIVLGFRAPCVGFRLDSMLLPLLPLSPGHFIPLTITPLVAILSPSHLCPPLAPHPERALLRMPS